MATRGCYYVQEVLAQRVQMRNLRDHMTYSNLQLRGKMGVKLSKPKLSKNSHS